MFGVPVRTSLNIKTAGKIGQILNEILNMVWVYRHTMFWVGLSAKTVYYDVLVAPSINHSTHPIPRRGW